MKTLTKKQLKERQIIINMMIEKNMDVNKYLTDEKYLKIINALAAMGGK